MTTSVLIIAIEKDYNMLGNLLYWIRNKLRQILLSLGIVWIYTEDLDILNDSALESCLEK